MGKKGQLIIFFFLQDGVNKLSLLLSSITTIQQSKLFLIKISSLGFDLLYKPFNPSSADLFSDIVCKKKGTSGTTRENDEKRLRH